MIGPVSEGVGGERTFERRRSMVFFGSFENTSEARKALKMQGSIAAMVGSMIFSMTAERPVRLLSLLLL